MRMLHFQKIVTVIFVFASIFFSIQGLFFDDILDEKLKVKRLNDNEPIISSQLFKEINADKDEGLNINGPSLIKVPQWLKEEGRVINKNANYYLYFAHHHGEYIRLAWATQIEGPYHLYDTRQTLGRRGVLDLGREKNKPLGNNVHLVNHVASPDVVVDDKQKLIKLFFHAS